ncbi:MAG: hypothetical protein ACUVUG_09835 [Candidatus Aminicenantia bacterium]
MIRWLIAGICSGLIIFFFHWLLSTVIFRKIYLDPNYSTLWRQKSGLLQFLFISIFCGLLFSLSFMLIYLGIPGGVLLKGLYFGLFGWLVFLLPTYLSQDIFINLPSNVVGIWLLQSLLGYGVAGIVTSLIVSPAIS